MRYLKWIFILLIISCAQQRDRIVIPSVGADFYSQALGRIDEDLAGDEDNLHLVEQKLYYCDYLNWPGTCIDALDEFRRQRGMTPQLLGQYTNYYIEHEQYRPLLEIINRWAIEFEFKESYLKNQILASTKLELKDQSTVLLRSYMIERSSLPDLKFAAERYIELEDTVMASYYLGKLMKLDARDDLIFKNYSLMLFDLGFEEKAFEILEQYSTLIPSDFDFQYSLASRYQKAGYYEEARDKLKPFVDADSIVYKVADLYLADFEWDSAHLYIDRLIEQDSVDRDAWLKKAIMFEDRGWLSYSLNYFSHVLYLYPGDTIARQRASQVRRKIAYLQRKNFEENQLPLPVIESKKLMNNE